MVTEAFVGRAWEGLRGEIQDWLLEFGAKFPGVGVPQMGGLRDGGSSKSEDV